VWSQSDIHMSQAFPSIFYGSLRGRVDVAG
jgi:hypothetical protein